MTAVEQVQSKAEDLKAEAMKALEVSFDHGIVIPKDDYEQAVDDVIAEGMAQMKVGAKDITINQILAAAKLKGEWKLKKRGQDTEIIKMMYRGASGFQSPTKPTNVGS
jgi:gamma-glutamyl:cysteine ligase YbdK (ATP-grasp superfamily)